MKIINVTLRQRILITLLPLLILISVVGIFGVVLLRHLGGSIDVILRENYHSVIAMEELKESLERIDSSFQFLLVAKGLPDSAEKDSLEKQATKQFQANWDAYRRALDE